MRDKLHHLASMNHILCHKAYCLKVYCLEKRKRKKESMNLSELTKGDFL